jgi:hypothetical protein
MPDHQTSCCTGFGDFSDALKSIEDTETVRGRARHAVYGFIMAGLSAMACQIFLGWRLSHKFVCRLT